MKKYILLFIYLSLSLLSCNKGFLDAKPNTLIINPTTLKDLEQLLENELVLNRTTPALSLISSDEYYFIDYAAWQAAFTPTERNSYIWAKDLYGGLSPVLDWNYSFTGIYYCNSILESLSKISKTEEGRWNLVKGRALFMRAYFMYDLVRNFSPTYDDITSATDLGLPIRLTAGIDEIATRSSVEQTYNFILKDLDETSTLLEPTLPLARNRPTKIAAYALFSRIYLSMRKYDKAEEYVDKTLLLYNKLIDYNTISKTATTPFSLNNVETIYSSQITSNGYNITLTSVSNTSISLDPELISLYAPKDLRLSIFFAKNPLGNLYNKRGYYGNGSFPYTGLATDEMYLIKAECLARRNEVNSAITWLNDLLKNRFAPSDFVPLTAATPKEALDKVLLERRKELVWRSLRWTDLKRLNKEGANITLKRVLNGVTYTLPPNDPRYVFPIPDDEIILSGIQQNIR